MEQLLKTLGDIGIMGIASWVLFGFFVITIGFGMLWGMFRGAKRTALRIFTLVIVFMGALLLTPVISGALYGALIDRIPGMLESQGISIDEMTQDLPVDVAILSDHLGGIVQFIVNIPLLFINLFVFIFLLFVLRFFSWIVFIIASGSIFPRKDKDGEKVRHSKLNGALVGAVCGLIVFFFVWIPVNGLASTLDRIDNYKSPMATTMNKHDTGIDAMDTINKAISDANSSFQRTPTGFVTKYTGVQWASDKALGYLWTIKAGSQRIDMKEFAATSMELTRDVTAVYYVFSDFDSVQDMTGLDAQKYSAMRTIVTKIFNMEITKLFLDANYVGIIEDHGWLDDFEISDYIPSNADATVRAATGADATDDDKSFGQILLQAIGAYNSASLKGDIISVINIAEMVFHTQGNYRLFTTVENLINAISNGTDAVVEDASDELYSALTQKVGKAGQQKELMTKIMNEFSGMHIFSDIVFNPKFSTLYSEPLMLFFGMSEEQATICFDDMMESVGLIITEAVKMTPNIVKLANNVTDIGALFDLIAGEEYEDSLFKSVANILDIITNEPGFGGISRGVLLYFIDIDRVKSLMGSNFDQINSIVPIDGDDGALTEIINLLKSDDRIDWDPLFENVYTLAKIAGPILNGGFDFNNLDKDDAKALLNLIKGNELIKGIIDPMIDMVEDAINDVLPEGISVEFTGGLDGAIELIEIIIDTIEIIGDLQNIDFETLDEETLEEIITIMADILESIADIGDVITIFIPEDLYDDLENIITELNLSPDVNISLDILKLFGATPAAA
jgi:hypothetical protein